MFSRNGSEPISNVTGNRPCADGFTYNIKSVNLEQFSCGGNQEAHNFRLAG
jgi:hypothetical protein